MWKLLLTALGGFIGGLFAYAVGREIVWVFQTRPAGLVIDDTLSAVGSLRWVDTTLVTGLAAVGAAYFSVYWVRRQIASASADTQKQIDHANWLHDELRKSKRDAARVTLPLALSAVCEYSEECARRLAALLPHVRGFTLPRAHPLPDMPSLPDNAIAVIKEVVEFVEEADRAVFAHLVRRIQVQNTRVRGLADEALVTRGIARPNLEAYIVDSILVYAQASDLFDFARYRTNEVSQELGEDSLGGAFASARIHGELRDRLADNARRSFLNEAA